MFQKNLKNTIIRRLSLVLTILISLTGLPALAQDFPSYLSNEASKRSAMEGKWSVQLDEQAVPVLSFLLEEFIRWVGPGIMLNEDCVVCNIPQLNSPCFIGCIVPARIVLTQESHSYWSQTIYQLSHEMCHYAFSQCKENKNCTLSWFEEIVCEAVSLCALEYAAHNWSNCQLAKLNPIYHTSIESYLNDRLAEEGTDGLKQCDSVAKLAEYETHKVAENQRETHRNEMHAVYRAISANPGELKCVLNYTKYLENNGVIIDFDRWIQDTPCNLLNILNQIQPVKQGNNNAN